jgi:hypothetical protein
MPWKPVHEVQFLDQARSLKSLPFALKMKNPSLARGAKLLDASYVAKPVSWGDSDRYCWLAVVAGPEELLESCSRSFFSRLISTRPPLMRLVLASSSVPATGALPMPTR